MATPKTLIVCCDGTWMNAVSKGSAGRPSSNVSRLTRVLRTSSRSGRPQVVLYHPGVGSSGQLLDAAMGGALGLGLEQDIRELYDYLCINYVDGDEIVLVGFSRGAFTARSVADLVASVGLLTPDGRDRFSDIFDDYENMGSVRRDPSAFLCPGLAPYRGQKGVALMRWEHDRKLQYRAWLKENHYTRDTHADGSDITIKALAVWDTVGSLGIPAAPLIGLHGSSQQWKFTNTHISARVEHAFQALALDEPRYDFLPSLWERLPDNTVTQLKQVWFPGAHSNVGGGLYDQQIADITLAWMCDQLATVGVECEPSRMAALFHDGLRYAAAHPLPYVPVHLFRRPVLPWASASLDLTSSSSREKRDTADCPGKYDKNHHHPDGPPPLLWHTARPWALGQTRCPTSRLQLAAGRTVRQPGRFVRVDPETNRALPDEPLIHTSERIHASVRVRLACAGLCMDDRHEWTCEGLTGRKGDGDHDSVDYLGNVNVDIDLGPGDQSRDRPPTWRLERVRDVRDARNFHGNAFPKDYSDPGSDPDSDSDSADGLYRLSKIDTAGQWQWVFNSTVRQTAGGQLPPVTVLPEEPPTGHWERLLLGMTTGHQDVFSWASANPPRHLG